MYSTKIHLKVTNQIQVKRMSLLLNKKIAFSHVGPSFVNPVNSVLGRGYRRIETYVRVLEKWKRVC